MIMRQSAVDVTLSGGTVPAGATVTCLIGAANRDPDRYHDPDRFDIFRDDLTTTTAFTAAADHLAFALGRHFCVGALLARAEVEIGVNQLLDAMPDVRLADGARPTERGVFTRGPQTLPVRFTPSQRRNTREAVPEVLLQDRSELHWRADQTTHPDGRAPLEGFRLDSQHDVGQSLQRRLAGDADLLGGAVELLQLRGRPARGAGATVTGGALRIVNWRIGCST